MLPLPPTPLLELLLLLLSPVADDDDDAAEEADAVDAERDAIAGDDDFVMMIAPTCRFDL